MISDHRKNARVSFFSGGDIYRQPDGERVGRILIKDVSATGLRVETLETLKQGEQVFIDFQIRETIFKRVPVRVERIQTHAGSFLSGLSFQREDVRSKVQEALRSII